MERADWNLPSPETPGETPPGGGGAYFQGLGRDPQGSLECLPTRSSHPRRMG